MPAKPKESGAETTARSSVKPKHYLVTEMKRGVKSWPVSTSELITLSILNPLGGAMIGWGVNLIDTWCKMDKNAELYKTIKYVAFGSFGGGVLIILISLLLIAHIWYGTRSSE